jgi:hypothetical protein
VFATARDFACGLPGRRLVDGRFPAGARADALAREVRAADP